MNRKTGRPSKLTPTVTKSLCAALRDGHYLETAAAAAGITRQTVRNWLKRGEVETDGPYRVFFNSIKKAEAQGEIALLKRLKAANKNGWQRFAWILERRHTEHWGRRRVELSGPDGGPIGLETSIAMSDEDLQARILQIAKVAKERANGSAG